MRAAAKKNLPSHAERPDLYDDFDGLSHAPDWKNPVGVPSRLQALIADRQAKAEPKRPARTCGLELTATTAAGKTIKVSLRKKPNRSAAKHAGRPKASAAV